MTDSDNESIATEDIEEQPVVEETKEPEPAPEPEPEPKKEKPKPKARGRPKGTKDKETKKPSTLNNLTKAEMLQMITDQHELLAQHKYRDEEMRKNVENTMKNRRVKKEVKEKKPRTPAQIAATQRMIEARKAKRKAELGEAGKEIAKDIDKSIADRVQEEVTNIVLKPLRALTPERVKKVEEIKQPKKNKYNSKLGDKNK